MMRSKKAEEMLDDIYEAQEQLKATRCFTFYGLAEKLIEMGYCKNVDQVLAKFVKALKAEFFFMKNSASKDALYQFTDSQLDRLLKQFCARECNNDR